MSLLLSNYTANGTSQTDEYGTLFALSDLIGNSGVIKGLAVVANSTPGMNVYVQTGSAAIGTGTSPTNYSYFVKNDTSGQGQQVTIGTAAASPRIDYVVMYVNKSQAASSASVNNTNNVVMLADVQGTPATSPSVPTTAQIQSAIGAANPYIILAQIAVGANVTQITNANITDGRSFAGVGSTNIANSSVTPAKISTSSFPRFRAYLNTSQASANNSVVKLDTVSYDNFSAFSTTTWRFTAPVAGYYSFSWNIQTSVGTSALSGLAINGTVVSRGGWAEGGPYVGSSGSDTAYLNVNDYAQVMCVQMGGTATLDTGTSITYMSGHMVP